MKNRKRILFNIFLALFSLTTFTLLSQNLLAEDQESQKTVIRKGDKLTIRVLEQESLSGPYTVFSDGILEFPYINEGIKAEGLTYEELSNKIKTDLEKDLFYKATVIVTPFRQNDINRSASRAKGGIVYVYGMASRTGVVEIPQNEILIVSKVIIRSGGFQDFANKRAVKLIRKSSVTGKTETRVLNMADIIDKGKLDQDIVVQNGDVIVVPEQFFNF